MFNYFFKLKITNFSFNLKKKNTITIVLKILQIFGLSVFFSTPKINLTKK